MKITVYEYKNCGTCRKALKYLATKNLEIDKKAIRETPPSKKELEQMLKHLGNRKKLINTSSKDYRESGLKDEVDKLSDSELIDRLHANGNLIKRPFILLETHGFCGFKEETYEEVF